MSVATNPQRSPLGRKAERLSPDRQREIGRLMVDAHRRGDTAEYERHRDRLVRVLIPWIVRRISRVRARGMKVDLDDMVSAAILGVLEGMPNYRPEMGAVTTFAGGYIHHGVGMYLKNHHLAIRVPAYLWDLRSKVVKGKIRREDLKPKQRDLLAFADAAMASFVAPPTADENGNDNPLSGLTTCDPDHDPDADRESRKLADRLHAALETLPDRWAESIRRRYGFGGEAETDEAIGRLWGVPGGIVRRYVELGLTQLRKALKENNQE